MVFMCACMKVIHFLVSRKVSGVCYSRILTIISTVNDGGLYRSNLHNLILCCGLFFMVIQDF